MRLVIDYQKCRKSGQCAYLHAELITADLDGIPRVIIETVSEDLHEAAEDVVDICPSGAIALVKEGAD